MLTTDEKIENLFMLSICKVERKFPINFYTINEMNHIISINEILHILFKVIHINKTPYDLAYINAIWNSLKKNIINMHHILIYDEADYLDSNIRMHVISLNEIRGFNINTWPDSWKKHFIHYFNELYKENILC